MYPTTYMYSQGRMDAEKRERVYSLSMDFTGDDTTRGAGNNLILLGAVGLEDISQRPTNVLRGLGIDEVFVDYRNPREFLGGLEV